MGLSRFVQRHALAHHCPTLRRNAAVHLLIVLLAQKPVLHLGPERENARPAGILARDALVVWSDAVLACGVHIRAARRDTAPHLSQALLDVLGAHKPVKKENRNSHKHACIFAVLALFLLAHSSSRLAVLGMLSALILEGTQLRSDSGATPGLSHFTTLQRFGALALALPFLACPLRSPPPPAGFIICAALSSFVPTPNCQEHNCTAKARKRQPFPLFLFPQKMKAPFACPI